MSVERLDPDKDADENVDADQIRTGRPVESEQSIGLFTQREQIDIDFRVSRLPHAVVKQAENFRVRELVKKIESHLHREAFRADLQQNNAYNPFSTNRKRWVENLGNVELFYLCNFCNTIPKVQCSQNAFFIGIKEFIVYWICGQFLVESESRRKLNKIRLDALSIPHYVIKKVWFHGARRGKNWGTKRVFRGPQFAEEMHINNNFDGIHDRFQRDP